MADLVAFLEARITEDEAVARAATQGRWSVDEHSDYDDPIISTDGPRRSSYDEGYVAQTRYDNQSFTDQNSEADAVFIAHNDPARVLAECKAKRALIADIQTDEHYADYEGLGDCMIIHDGSTAACTCGTDERIQRRLAILAQPYAGHPDFDPTWTL